jgi:hypothetical protein
MRTVRLAFAGLFLAVAAAHTASAQTCLTIVTIDGTGKLAGKPQAMLCHPDDKVFWVVVNEHQTSTVKVTFDTFVIRGTATGAEPLIVNAHSMNVGKDDVDVSKKIRVKANLPPNGFKYSITVAIGGTQTDHMDPDLDVTPPPSPAPPFGPPRGRGRAGGGR